MPDDDAYNLEALYEEGGAAPSPGMGVQQLAARQQRLGSIYLYSCRRWEAIAPPTTIAPAEYDVFVAAVGEQGQGWGTISLTNWITNLISPGRVADGESWVISHIGVFFPAGNWWEDVIGFCRTTQLFFRKRSMKWNLGPVELWPGGSGLTGPGVSTTNPLSNFVPELQNGVPAAGAMTKLTTPVELASGENFRFGLEVCNHGLSWEIQQDFLCHVKLFGEFAEAVPT